MFPGNDSPVKRIPLSCNPNLNEPHQLDHISYKSALDTIRLISFWCTCGWGLTEALLLLPLLVSPAVVAEVSAWWWQSVSSRPLTSSVLRLRRLRLAAAAAAEAAEAATEAPPTPPAATAVGVEVTAARAVATASMAGL